VILGLITCDPKISVLHHSAMRTLHKAQWTWRGMQSPYPIQQHYGFAIKK
jgi:hypothetical protein